MKHRTVLITFCIIGLLCSLLPTFSTAAQDDLFFPSLSSHYKKAKVLRVISADTLELTNNEKIRLIGLRALPAPKNTKVERNQYGFVIEDKKPFDTLEEKAFSFTQRLLEGKDVRIELDTQKKDNNFYTLAYVFLSDNNLFVNEEILKKGFAHLQIRPPNMKYTKILRAAYKKARGEKRGLHNSY